MVYIFQKSINMIMLKLLLISVVFLCTGCTVTVSRARFYLESESMPTVTNDSNYGTDKKINSRIMIYGGKAEYQRIYTF